MKSLLDREPGNPTFAASLARFKADLSDLLSSLDHKPEALAQAQEAIALLDKLSMPGPPGSYAEVDLRVSIARTYGLAGHVTEDAKQIAQAQACFSKAVAQYESVTALRAGDDALERDLTWSRMRLAKLKP